MSDDAQPRMGPLIGTIALFTVLGAPILAFLWETLNRVLAGHFDLVRIGISLPLMVVFYFVLRWMARVAERITV
jgi:hypothetical protein